MKKIKHYIAIGGALLLWLSCSPPREVIKPYNTEGRTGCKNFLASTKYYLWEGSKKERKQFEELLSQCTLACEDIGVWRIREDMACGNCYDPKNECHKWLVKIAPDETPSNECGKQPPPPPPPPAPKSVNYYLNYCAQIETLSLSEIGFEIKCNLPAAHTMMVRVNGPQLGKNNINFQGNEIKERRVESLFRYFSFLLDGGMARSVVFGVSGSSSSENLKCSGLQGEIKQVKSAKCDDSCLGEEQTCKIPCIVKNDTTLEVKIPGNPQIYTCSDSNNGKDKLSANQILAMLRAGHMMANIEKVLHGKPVAFHYVNNPIAERPGTNSEQGGSASARTVIITVEILLY